MPIGGPLQRARRIRMPTPHRPFSMPEYPARLRRCRHLLLEPREQVEFDLESLLQGGDGLAAERRWVALAPHLDTEVEVEAEALAVLGAAEVHAWGEVEALTAMHPRAVVDRLLDQGLLIGDHDAHVGLREREAALRDLHWWTPAAVAWWQSRWRGVDAEADSSGAPDGIAAMIERYGAPPPEVVAHASPERRLPLPRPPGSLLDTLLTKRLTCRNFDPRTPLPLADFAAVLHRVFAAHGAHELAPGAVALKKSSPSGGGLHPLEAYALVRRVEGVAPGLYHYHCTGHALEPLTLLVENAAAELASEFVAGQSWFAQAPVLIAITTRFLRHQWKYRQHPKAYRVLHLEAGHFSQTLFLAAAELGLGAYITAAINEHAIERALGLDGMHDGPLAVCGFGARAAAMTTFEFDPAGAVWGTRAAP